MTDRLHQPALDQRHMLRHHRQQRFGHAAKYLVKPDQRVGSWRFAIAEAALDRIAANRREFAHPLQSKAAQYRKYILVQPKSGHRQIGELRLEVFLTLQYRARRAIMG